MSASLVVVRCASCELPFLPPPGPCPRCGGAPGPLAEIPNRGVVLAATELLSPAAGWSAPHRLGLVEAAEAIRILGVADGALPAPGQEVEIRWDEGVYRFRRPGESAEAPERGEGESPKTGRARPSFEPPR